MSNSMIFGLAMAAALLNLVMFVTDTEGTESIYASALVFSDAATGAQTLIIRAEYDMRDPTTMLPVGVRRSQLARVGAKARHLVTATMVAPETLTVSAVGPIVNRLDAQNMMIPTTALTLDDPLDRAVPAGAGLITNEWVEFEDLKTPQYMQPSGNFLTRIPTFVKDRVGGVSKAWTGLAKLGTLDYAILRSDVQIITYIRWALAAISWAAYIIIALYIGRLVRGLL